MSAAVDYMAGGDVGYTGGILSGDETDTAHLAPYVQTAPGMKWWEGLVAYGFTKAIDNKLGPTQVAGNTQAGSYAGQNGRTYGNNGSAQAGVVSLGGLQVPSWALIAAVAAVGYLALRKA